jgi:predicted transcriptional regulator YdeE
MKIIDGDFFLASSTIKPLKEIYQTICGLFSFQHQQKVHQIQNLWQRKMGRWLPLS